MMRKLFLLATAAFWIAVLAVWIDGARSPTPAVPQSSAAARHTLAEVSRHSTAEDCWMAIGGKVYDVTTYLPEHPAAPSVILPWCGKDASEAYRTKTRGRSHSAQADRLLLGYDIGELAAE